MTRTREALSSKLDKLFLGKRIIDLDLLDELEELLISADMGVETSLELIEKTRDKVRRKELTDPARLKAHLKDEMLDLLTQVTESKAPESYETPGRHGHWGKRRRQNHNYCQTGSL